MSGGRYRGPTDPKSTFDPEQFSKLVEGLGTDFRWHRAIPCPCLTSESRQADPSCARCLGDGWTYVNPSAATERHLSRPWCAARGVLSSVTEDPTLFEKWGPYSDGRATLTLDGYARVGFRDRFVSVDHLMPWAQLVRRETDSDDVPVGLLGRTREGQESALRYEPVEILYVTDQDGVEYWEGEDWKLVEGDHEAASPTPATWRWLAGRGPADGKWLSVSYVARPIFVVDKAVFAIQSARGPARGLAGVEAPRALPTTFSVCLDYLTDQQG